MAPHVDRARVGQRRAAEDADREELVVRGEKRPGRVENPDAAVDEPIKCP